MLLQTLPNVSFPEIQQTDKPPVLLHRNLAEKNTANHDHFSKPNN